ncbi:hypothetical protein ACEPAG_9031 [Sanghuangporus baumii]
MDALPSEILCNIFLMTLPYPSCQTPMSMAICISHVCRSWRATALWYGKLWSYLCINYNVTKCRNRRKMLEEVFDTWLSRTNGSPISYVFLCSLNGEADKEDHHRAEHIITTLLSYQHRWKDVTFSWKGVEFSSGFPGMSLINMPLMESLVFDVDLPIRASINIAQSSRLRSLVLRGNHDLLADEGMMHLLKDPIHVSFWSSNKFAGDGALVVQQGTLRCTLFDVFFEAVIDWDLSNSSRSAYRLYLYGPLHAPNVKALSLACRDAPSAVIDNLILPSLRALHYTSDACDGILLRFFQKSMPPLTFLSVHGDCTREDALIPIFRSLPSLKHLRYTDAFVSRRFFRELTVVDKDDREVSRAVEHTLCPALETVYFSNLRHFDTISDCVEAWINMLKSRAKIQKTFEKLHVGIDIEYTETVDASEIDKYTAALEYCFDDCEGSLIAGDFNYVIQPGLPTEVRYKNISYF